MKQRRRNSAPDLRESTLDDGVGLHAQHRRGNQARLEQIRSVQDAPDPRLVAHELAHVAQQSGGRALPGAPDAESDADAAADAVVTGRAVEVRQRTSVSARLFTGDEHVQIGNEAAKKALANVGLSK